MQKQNWEFSDTIWEQPVRLVVKTARARPDPPEQLAHAFPGDRIPGRVCIHGTYREMHIPDTINKLFSNLGIPRAEPGQGRRFFSAAHLVSPDKVDVFSHIFCCTSRYTSHYTYLILRAYSSLLVDCGTICTVMRKVRGKIYVREVRVREVRCVSDREKNTWRCSWGGLWRRANTACRVLPETRCPEPFFCGDRFP